MVCNYKTGPAHELVGPKIIQGNILKSVEAEINGFHVVTRWCGQVKNNKIKQMLLPSEDKMSRQISKSVGDAVI